jgi:Pyruvate/2-oxoglutarate dehydrogenase complex, dihydrolipoamide dehydrogenase (E3) component, and related enzymes
VPERQNCRHGTAGGDHDVARRTGRRGPRRRRGRPPSAREEFSVSTRTVRAHAHVGLPRNACTALISGIAVGVGAEAVRHDGTGFTVTLSGGEELTAEHLLVATGRRVDLAGLGVGAVGLDETARSVPTDERLRAAPGVWAVGDVTGQGALTHVAAYQAPIAAADILGEDGPPADHHAVPRVTFTDPEVGAVGLTEAAARERGLRVRVGLAQVPSTARGWRPVGGGPRPGAHRGARPDDLRLPDVPPRHLRRPARPRRSLTSRWATTAPRSSACSRPTSATCASRCR